MTAALLTINRRAFASLRMHRNYRLYFLGQAVSQSGTWIDKVAQAWLVLALTHSAFAVGLLAACQFVPFSVLGLMAGVIVDRLDTRRTVVVTQAIRMVLAATLAGIVLGGVVQVWMVYTLAVLTGIVLVLAPQHSLGPAIVLLFVAGICFTLYTANSNAVLQLRAPDHLRGRVIGFYYFAFNGLAPLGGILTGWLAATGGTELAFAVAGTVTALVALTALPQLPHVRAEPA